MQTVGINIAPITCGDNPVPFMLYDKRPTR